MDNGRKRLKELEEIKERIEAGEGLRYKNDCPRITKSIFNNFSI
jgi:hypothetical protein